jgi:hypothetical protein
MKLRIGKWRHYVVAGTALVVVTAGIAATPLRKSLTPFVAKPLGSWAIPIGRPSGQPTAPTAYHSSPAPATPAGDLTPLTEPRDYTLARNDSEIVPLGDVTEHGRGGAAASSTETGGSWKLGPKARSWGFGRAGTSGGLGRSGFGGAGSIGRGIGNGGSRLGSAGSESESGSGSAGSGAGGSQGGVGTVPIFGDHKSGLPELTGSISTGPGAGTVSAGKTNLASNPEPSTMLLFGTGLASAAGALRRRLRRS